MTAISVENLGFSVGMKTILQNVSFSLEEGDKLGIIGVNGSGKSTLFKLITGEYEPSEGCVYISKDKNVGVLTQDGAFDISELCGDTVLEQMYSAFPEFIRAERRLSELESLLRERAGESESDYYRSLTLEYTELYNRFVSEGGPQFRGRAASILKKMGFDDEMLNQKCSELSGGQRTRLALSRQLCREPDLLLLDEPTNHLDMETMRWLENFLVSYKKNVLVISHDRYFLDRVTNKTLLVEHNRAKLYAGGYTASMEQRRIDREIAERHYKNQQKEIARQEAYIAQQRAWNRERNIIAAESRQKALDRMVKLEKPQNDPKGIRMTFTKGGESGNEVLSVKNLSMSFGEKKLFEDISFLIKKKEKVFIVGANGCGKSTLIKILLGKLAAVGGRVETGYNVEIGYYDQENQNLDMKNTVIDELWNAYPFMKETEIRNTLALFRFIGEDVYKEVSVLSGGERARLTLAKLILSHMNLLILDEPTNHLDIGSREALESALQSYEGTVITVSHDRYFIGKLATRIIEIKPGDIGGSDILDYTITKVGEGYDEYLGYREAREERLMASSVPERISRPSTEKEQYLKAKQSASETRKELKRLERLKKEAEQLEGELEEVEEELYGSAASDYMRAAELDARKNEIEERLMEIYEEIGC
ncbi:MAG: ABC-F family ATP-binding cassette domain-containing protein [Clostridia bacterium]|nr:ABC-F family ATP-binding cassette domain-containing protein [Clostridia bacterium]